MSVNDKMHMEKNESPNRIAVQFGDLSLLL